MAFVLDAIERHTNKSELNQLEMVFLSGGRTFLEKVCEKTSYLVATLVNHCTSCPRVPTKKLQRLKPMTQSDYLNVAMCKGTGEVCSYTANPKVCSSVKPCATDFKSPR